MVVASLPVLQLIILKAVFYQDPFLLFLNPPSLTQVLLAPKIQTTLKHQQERKNKRCLVALWHRREPKDRCFMVEEHFHAKKLALSFDNPVEFFSQLGKTIDVSGFLWFAYRTNLQVTNLDTILR